MELDQTRAAAIHERAASTTANGTVLTSGDEPLVVDLVPPDLTGKHWIVEHLTFLANLTTRQPGTQGVLPVSGLFLCPIGTPAPSLVEAQAGWSPSTRGLILPLNDPYIDSAIIGGGTPFAIGMALRAGFKITVPNGWIVRAVVIAQAGVAAPGPGIGSSGTIRALVYEEPNQC